MNKLAHGIPFLPPDIEEFKAVAIKYNGNAKAIAKHFNIIPHTLYSYFKKDPKAKVILDEIRGYNSFTDLDIAEFVNRYNMTKYEENPAIAQRSAEFTLRYKGRERGWFENETKEISTEDEKIENTLDVAKLRAENAELRRMLNESKAGTEHIPSEQETEYMVRSSSIGEDLQQHLQTD